MRSEHCQRKIPSSLLPRAFSFIRIAKEHNSITRSATSSQGTALCGVRRDPGGPMNPCALFRPSQPQHGSRPAWNRARDFALRRARVAPWPARAGIVPVRTRGTGRRGGGRVKACVGASVGGVGEANSAVRSSPSRWAPRGKRPAPTLEGAPSPGRGGL